MADLRLVQAAVPAVRSLPPLIAGLGAGDDGLLPALERADAGMVASTVAQARVDPGLARLARERHGLEVLLDPETWRSPLPHHPLGPDQLTAHVRRTLEELAALRATVFVAPYHLGGGPDCPIRSTDLRLARRAASAFRSLRLDEPRSGEPFPVARRLLAGIAIRPDDLLDPVGRHMLVRLYGAIDVAGYLVRVAGLCEHSPIAHVEAAADFAFGLHRGSERDVILGGGRNLALAFVAAGLPATLQELGGRGARPVYHPALWRSVRAASAASAARMASLFARQPCGCGHHPAASAPRTGPALAQHTLATRLADVRAVAAWPADDAVRRMRMRAAEIDAVAAATGYDRCPATFVTVTRAAERFAQRAASGAPTRA